MRKLFILLVLLFVSITASAQENILEATGHDWITWAPEQQFAWVYGFTYAMETVRVIIYYSDELSLEKKQEYLEYFFFSSIEEIGYSIDTYYRTTEDLDSEIWSVVLYTFNKHWWSNDQKDSFEELEEKLRKDLEMKQRFPDNTMPVSF